ncbi:MAG: diguanylate cyclase [Nitrospiria bacterium]
MKNFGDMKNSRLEAVQDCLSSLTDFPIFIWDFRMERSIVPVPEESILSHLILGGRQGSECRREFKKELDLAVQTEEMVFYKCRENMNYFLIPICISEEVNWVIVGGQEQEEDGKKDPVFQDKRRGEWEGRTEKAPLEVEDPFFESARILQSVGTALLENIFYRNKYQLKSALLTTLLNIGNQFKKDETSFELNMSLLINTLGILFGFKRAGVFYRENPDGLHKAVSVYGEKKEALHEREAVLDLLIERHKNGKPYIYCEESLKLLKSKLPEDVTSCYLFPIYEKGASKITLTVLDTSLGNDEAKMIHSFCRQAGAIHENIELQNHLKRHKKIVQSFSKFTTIVDSPRYLEALHENILDQVTQLLCAEQGSLMIMNPENKELVIKAMTGVNKTLLEMLSIKPGEGIAGQVFQDGNPILVQDLSADPRIRQNPNPRYRTPSFVSVPLKLRSQPFGVLNLADKTTGRVFSNEDLQLLMAVGGYISIALERHQLYEKARELKRISITDSLTGLLNRRYFHERLLEEVERTRRHQLPVSLIMIDLDNFKSFNDRYGHQGGDEILRFFSHAIRKYIRAIDVPCRYGGEEFTVILPQTSKVDAEIIAERLCRGINEKETLHRKFSSYGTLAVSVGLATFPEDAKTPEELIRNADRALYRAKIQGKNQVVVFNGNAFP